jgi:aspartyl-tRNA(Asn)/glutamyl-tRNA(Gln) amidotransferase subunit C
MATDFDRGTARRVARLARLELTDKEAEAFSRDMDEILTNFRRLQRIDTEGVRPTLRPVESFNVLRDDAVEPSIPRERLIGRLRNKEEGFIKGPRVV